MVIDADLQPDPYFLEEIVDDADPNFIIPVGRTLSSHKHRKKQTTAPS
jgi:hypothetical protein